MLVLPQIVYLFICNFQPLTREICSNFSWAMHFDVNSKRERGAYIYQWSPPSVRVERIFTNGLLQVCVWSVYLPCCPPSVSVERIFTMLSSKCKCGAYIYHVVLQVCLWSVYLPCYPPNVSVERIFTILSYKCTCGAYIYLCCHPSVRVERIFTILSSKCECGAQLTVVIVDLCCPPNVSVERIFTYVVLQVCVQSVWLMHVNKLKVWIHCLVHLETSSLVQTLPRSVGDLLILKIL